jgi:hypothetical protein
MQNGIRHSLFLLHLRHLEAMDRNTIPAQTRRRQPGRASARTSPRISSSGSTAGCSARHEP